MKIAPAFCDEHREEANREYHRLWKAKYDARKRAERTLREATIPPGGRVNY